MSFAGKAWHRVSHERGDAVTVRQLLEVVARLPLCAVLAWVAVTANSAPVQAQRALTQRPTSTSVDLAPHRAVYEITLADSRKSNSISDMSGRMVYELTGSACSGYTQKMRFVTRVANPDGAASITDMRSTSWEDAVAKAFRFNSSQYKDTKLEETTDGDAARTGAELKVELSKPAKKAVSFKRETYFPVQHSIALLAAARRGQRIFVADLYDGSEKGEKVFTTASYIGTAKPGSYNRSLPKLANIQNLDGLTSWPISISYFELGDHKADTVPAYELAFLYFENGVSRRLFIDYGDFAVNGTLKNIEFLPPTPCARPR
jgi:hypothetical protein